MSSIEKLSIRGIRSFSPNREEIIEFYHPLTVILGDNGSGKTTIIECLKIACTGSLPPGAKSGQSFIHDTRIAGTTEVKASIRLRFRNRAGKPMVVQRTFQVQQTKSGVKYKALDGAIRIKNEVGENVSMSHKCAELDRHIPDMLGVSKAIIESVIFCHQEESNWPLQEGSVLKRRFDDIFESARYTKALVAIRKLKKARADNAKDFKRDLDVLNIKLKSVEEIQGKIDAENEKLDAAKYEAEDLEKSVDSAQETLDEMEQLHKDIEQQHHAVQRLELIETQKQESVQNAYDNISEMMSDKDEELQILLKNFDAVVKEHEDICRHLVGEESQLEGEIKTARDKFTKLCTAKGTVEAKIESQQQRVTELLELAATIGTKYQFHTQQLSSQGEDVKSFLSKFQHYVGEKTAALKQLEMQNRRAEDSVNSALADLKSKLHHAKEDSKTKEQDLGALNVEKRKNATKLKDLSAKAIPSTREVEEADKLIEEAKTALQKFRDDSDMARAKAEIDALNKQIRDVAYDIEQLANKIELLKGTEMAQMALEAKTQQLHEKEEELKVKLADKIAEYRSIVDGDMSPEPSELSGVTHTLHDALEARKEAVRSKKDQLKAANAKLQENLGSSKHIEKTLADLRLEKNELERGPVGEIKRLLQEFSPNEDVRNADDVLQKAERAYLAAKDKTARTTNTIKFLEVFKKKGVKEKCCPLCTRAMSQEEEELFVRTINEKTDDNKVKDKIKKAEVAESSALNMWKGIDAQMPSWRKWMRMETQIATKSSELDTLYAAKRSFQADVNDIEQQLKRAETRVEEVDDAVHAFASLTTLADELTKLRLKIKSEKERLRTSSTDILGANAPSFAEVQKIHADKQAHLQDLNNQVQRKQAHLQHLHETHQHLQNALHKKRDEMMAIEELRKQYVLATAEQGRLREHENALRSRITQLQEDVTRLEKDVQAKMKELQDLREGSAGRIEQARSEEKSCLQDFGLIQDKWKTVEEQSTEKLDDQLKKLGEQIAQTKQKELAANHALEDLAPKIMHAKENLGKQETFHRKIRDNLEYRRLKAEREHLRSEIEHAKLKLTSLPALSDVQRRVESAKNTLCSARDRRSGLRGRMQQMEDQIRELKIKLRSAEFKNVEEKHRQKLIQHETTMMAVADLDKYYKALDQSLQLYHKKKIEEINSIIKSLWQITYKGQDIDTIELVSGQEMDTGSTSKASRSYDYRVVMKKGGALIDMRGRCSAGQKVLAALVIRLALAETFCLNCGILALDEPTTNLDTENKFGLAQAITDILNARSEQQNFQLVCITHDEEFVQMLNEAQAMGTVRPEFYWRISREDIGNNRFCSKIERREWRDGN